MFEIQYKIVPFEFDDYIGQEGFLKISGNGSYFDEIWPDELNEVMPTDYFV